jgi:hypothetical protein
VRSSNVLRYASIPPVPGDSDDKLDVRFRPSRVRPVASPRRTPFYEAA